MAERGDWSSIDNIYRMARAGRDPLHVVEPKAAVAVILWRCVETSEAGASEPGESDQPCAIEIYLGQRAHTMRFLPGMWTFPGGLIAPRDGAQGSSGAPAEIAAAMREVREETGLELPAPGGHTQWTFAGRLGTPEVASLRFDTALYLVEVPRGAVADHRAAQGELQDGCWVTPSQAMSHARDGTWLIPEPTLHIIEALEPGMEGAAERCQQAAERLHTAIRAYLVMPGIWISPVRTPTLPPASSTNCYVIGDRELVVIDPASPYEPERAALDHALSTLQARGHRIVEIWLTHHHGDHIGGAAHLSQRLGVPIAAHANTIDILRSRSSLGAMSKSIPMRVLEHGDTLELDGEPRRRVRVVYTPGHAPGHICVLEEHTGFLIAGDMVAGVGTIVIEPDEGDMALYLESLERMKQLSPRALLPAHGSIILNARAKIDEYIHHRLWREDRVLQALQENTPATSRELVRTAYSDVPPMVHPLAERSLVAHLIKLERDGKAARDGDTWRSLPGG